MAKAIIVKAEGKDKEEIKKEILEKIDEEINNIIEEQMNEEPAKMHIICEEDTELKGFSNQRTLVGGYAKVFCMMVEGVTDALLDMTNGEPEFELLTKFISALTEAYSEDRSKVRKSGEE